MANIEKTDLYKQWLKDHEAIQSGVIFKKKDSTEEQEQRIAKAQTDY